ncbi:MAG: DUF4271 domain-containing protein [Ferruginibacter sp.]
MKQVLFVLFFFITPVLLSAQHPDSILVKPDSTIIKDSAVIKDSTAIKDSINKMADSLKLLAADSIARQLDKVIAGKRSSYIESISKIIKNSYYLSSAGRPVAMTNKARNYPSPENIFYLLLLITAILGFFRFFYTRYFNNLFRVFFNASLRQSQLTDQLLQAKLPSLFFNIVFVLTGGVYVYLLLNYYGWFAPGNFWLVVFYCALSLAIIYIGKLISLKFTGWVTGYKEITNSYIFIIFLINKILGILLLPFAIVIAFCVPSLITASVIISLLLISLMFLLRFFRSYGLLQHQLKISKFHFFMYVVGVEIIPLLLIYKALILLLSKNL